MSIRQTGLYLNNLFRTMYNDGQSVRDKTNGNDTNGSSIMKVKADKPAAIQTFSAEGESQWE